MAIQSMVALLREARGWTQTDLAREAHLSQAVVSKLETGTVDLEGERLDQVAAALDCPPEILKTNMSMPNIEITCLHRRRASTMTVGTMKRIEAVTHLTRISVEGLLDGIELVSTLDFDRIPVDQTHSPSQIAHELRQRWHVPTGPIKNLVRLVEAAGIIIVIRPFGTTGQDAVSTWPNDSSRPPMMLVNSGLSPDRLRFTIAHELGHLTMHTLPGDDQEREANIFAGEFLAPAAEIRPALSNLTTSDFRRLMALKTEWGMSMAALIRRAHDIDTISDRQYREFQVRLGKLGWRTGEPGEVARETPTSVDKVIDLHRTHNKHDDGELARLARMTEASFRRHYLPGDETPAARTPLRLALDD